MSTIKPQLRNKITLKIIDFFRSGRQNIWLVARSMYCGVKKYVSRALLKLMSKSFTPDFRTKNEVFFEEV